MRNLFVLTALLALSACATVTPVKAVKHSAADTPLAVLGVFECDKMQGIIVVTADGKFHVGDDTSQKDLQELSALVPKESAMSINLASDCTPTQST
jgi:hypothetical protein